MRIIHPLTYNIIITILITNTLINTLYIPFAQKIDAFISEWKEVITVYNFITSRQVEGETDDDKA